MKILPFIKPTRYKFIFWVEWLVFLFILFRQGKIQSCQQVGAAAAPFLFFYLFARILFEVNEIKSKPISLWGLLGAGAGLVMVDQALKIVVTKLLPYNTVFPIFPGWLEITHRTNPHGAWVLTHLKTDTIPWITPIVVILVFGLLFLIIPIFRYYRKDREKSFWVEACFVLILAGLLSWLVDMLTRGRIIDFIGLPSLVAADTKDLYLYFGAAALVMEVIDNPHSDWGWKGLKKEWASLCQFFHGVRNMMLEDLKNIYAGISSVIGFFDSSIHKR